MTDYKRIPLIILMIGMLMGFSFAQDDTTTAPQTSGALTVTKLAVGTGVENRELVGEAQSFPAATEKVYCFLEAKDIPADTDAIFVWYLGDKEVNKTTLPVRQGARWRTWANKTINGKTGDWKIELQDANGSVLSTVTFKVE